VWSANRTEFRQERVLAGPRLTGPRPAADRIKTDKHDAVRLAKLLAAGDLTLVTIPSVEREQLRDLRCREDVRVDLARSASDRGFLLRREIYCDRSVLPGAHTPNSTPPPTPGAPARNRSTSLIDSRRWPLDPQQIRKQLVRAADHPLRGHFTRGLVKDSQHRLARMRV